MWMIYKLIKGFVRALISAAAPWQIGVAAALGVLLGCLPLWLGGPNPLALAVLVLAIVLNCHLGTLFVFWGVMKLLSFAIAPLALALGNALDGLAQTAAGMPLLHASHWSHTGWLGLALIGIIVAPLAGFAMARGTVAFRTKLQARMLANRKLAVAGKVGGNGLLVRFGLWFFDL